MKSILLVKKLLGLVEMTSGLVNVSFSLPKWQAVKMIFFAPWTMILSKICECRAISPNIFKSQLATYNNF